MGRARRHRRHAGRHERRASARRHANHFTAASGPEVYRGHRLPADMVGDLFFTEPVGRIVRRAKVVVTEGLTQLQNAYPKSEFIRSTDPLFRPVNLSNAPDGTLYLVDMYTGIIQDAQFVGPGCTCAARWSSTASTGSTTGDASGASHTRPDARSDAAGDVRRERRELVAHLEHPSGWWRDTAQKLLVLRRDQTVVPRLQTMARTSSTSWRAIHALWTLEGLGGSMPALARELMKDADPEIRIQAIRASETLYKAGDQSFAADYRALARRGSTRRHSGAADAEPAARAAGSGDDSCHARRRTVARREGDWIGSCCPRWRRADSLRPTIRALGYLNLPRKTGRR